MAPSGKKRHRMAKFPRLRQIREDLGWEVTDLINKLPLGKPSISSIYRLEQGHAIRMANVRRVFDVVNNASSKKLEATKEIKAS
jgi:predicted transcriptional regulator